MDADLADRADQKYPADVLRSQLTCVLVGLPIALAVKRFS